MLFFMKRVLIYCLFVVAIAACSKDKFKTVPQVTIESFGPQEVRKGQIIQLRVTVTDKEGDLQDSIIIVRKRFNGTTLLSTDSSIRSSLAALGVPVKQKIEIQYFLPYGELLANYKEFQNLESVDRNFKMGIIVRDKEGNRSEYVETEAIVLKKL